MVVLLLVLFLYWGRGRRGLRSDTQEDFVDLVKKKGKKIDTQMVDFLELADKVKAGVKNLGYGELIQLLSRVDQAKIGVNQRLQFVSQEFDLVYDNEGVGSFDGFDLASGNVGPRSRDAFDLVSGNVVSDGLSFLEGFDLVSGNVFYDYGAENGQDCDVNVFDIKNLEAWLNDNQEFDKEVSNTEFIASLEEEMC
ncbi:hypothetical protein Patl1_27896 [Pistacia atlantica]|uniref:Uncharacterized protein n=1 Tax=Pistacia atlantica TaxID=434234 RepID=A0ACC1BBX5_9ROSI|nr:hypothetical protein Patl1_27896 [Pistacia atlantica]